MADGSKPESTPIYDKLVSEVATLECVHATLDALDEGGLVGSAEVTLLQSIERLQEIVNDISNIAMLSPKQLPPNRLCCADDPEVTLDSANRMMELINALDCNEGTSEFEMPESGASSLARLREMVQDALQHAADVRHVEANLN
jgi:hypothetical protein